jgi:glycerol-3-phosphate dehydrogenase
VDEKDPLLVYGSDAEKIRAMIRRDPALGEQLHPDLPYRLAEVAWAVDEEMAMRLEDVLARRLRVLFLDARVALEIAPSVARFMAQRMQKDESWVEAELSAFRETAKHYLP